MFKKIIATILATTLVLSLCVSVSAADSSAKVTKKNWYMKVICGDYRACANINKKYDLAQYKFYKLVDINKDGTKELLLSTTSESLMAPGQKTLVLNFYKKKIKATSFKSGKTGQQFMYKKKKKVFLRITYVKNNSYMTIYNLKKGKLKKVCNLKYVLKNKKFIYYYNGKKTSEKKMTKILNKYYKGAKKISFKAI